MTKLAMKRKFARSNFEGMRALPSVLAVAATGQRTDGDTACPMGTAANRPEKSSATMKQKTRIVSIGIWNDPTTVRRGVVTRPDWDIKFLRLVSSHPNASQCKNFISVKQTNDH